MARQYKDSFDIEDFEDIESSTELITAMVQNIDVLETEVAKVLKKTEGTIISEALGILQEARKKSSGTQAKQLASLISTLTKESDRRAALQKKATKVARIREQEKRVQERVKGGAKTTGYSARAEKIVRERAEKLQKEAEEIARKAAEAEKQSQKMALDLMKKQKREEERKARLFKRQLESGFITSVGQFKWKPVKERPVSYGVKISEGAPSSGKLARGFPFFPIESEAADHFRGLDYILKLTEEQKAAISQSGGELVEKSGSSLKDSWFGFEKELTKYINNRQKELQEYREELTKYQPNTQEYKEVLSRIFSLTAQTETYRPTREQKVYNATIRGTGYHKIREIFGRLEAGAEDYMGFTQKDYQDFLKDPNLFLVNMLGEMRKTPVKWLQAHGGIDSELASLFLIKENKKGGKEVSVPKEVSSALINLPKAILSKDIDFAGFDGRKLKIKIDKIIGNEMSMSYGFKDDKGRYVAVKGTYDKFIQDAAGQIWYMDYKLRAEYGKRTFQQLTQGLSGIAAYALANPGARIGGAIFEHIDTRTGHEGEIIRSGFTADDVTLEDYEKFLDIVSQVERGEIDPFKAVTKMPKTFQKAYEEEFGADWKDGKAFMVADSKSKPKPGSPILQRGLIATKNMPGYRKEFRSEFLKIAGLKSTEFGNIDLSQERLRTGYTELAKKILKSYGPEAEKAGAGFVAALEKGDIGQAVKELDDYSQKAIESDTIKYREWGKFAVKFDPSYIKGGVLLGKKVMKDDRGQYVYVNDDGSTYPVGGNLYATANQIMAMEQGPVQEAFMKEMVTFLRGVPDKEKLLMTKPEDVTEATSAFDNGKYSKEEMLLARNVLFKLRGSVMKWLPEEQIDKMPEMQILKDIGMGRFSPRSNRIMLSRSYPKLSEEEKRFIDENVDEDIVEDFVNHEIFRQMPKEITSALKKYYKIKREISEEEAEEIFLNNTGDWSPQYYVERPKGKSKEAKIEAEIWDLYRQMMEEPEIERLAYGKYLEENPEARPGVNEIEQESTGERIYDPEIMQKDPASAKAIYKYLWSFREMVRKSDKIGGVFKDILSPDEEKRKEAYDTLFGGISYLPKDIRYTSVDEEGQQALSRIADEFSMQLTRQEFGLTADEQTKISNALRKRLGMSQVRGEDLPEFLARAMLRSEGAFTTILPSFEQWSPEQKKFYDFYAALNKNMQEIMAFEDAEDMTVGEAYAKAIEPFSKEASEIFNTEGGYQDFLQKYGPDAANIIFRWGTVLNAPSELKKDFLEDFSYKWNEFAGQNYPLNFLFKKDMEGITGIEAMQKYGTGPLGIQARYDTKGEISSWLPSKFGGIGLADRIPNPFRVVPIPDKLNPFFTYSPHFLSAEDMDKLSEQKMVEETPEEISKPPVQVEVVDEPTEGQKEEIKQEVKEEIKEEIKEEAKEELKEGVVEEVKKEKIKRKPRTKRKTSSASKKKSKSKGKKAKETPIIAPEGTSITADDTSADHIQMGSGTINITDSSVSIINNGAVTINQYGKGSEKDAAGVEVPGLEVNKATIEKDEKSILKDYIKDNEGYHLKSSRRNKRGYSSQRNRRDYYGRYGFEPRYTQRSQRGFGGNFYNSGDDDDTNLFSLLRGSFGGYFSKMASIGWATAIIASARRAMQQLIQTTQALDKSLTDLRVVTGYNKEEATNLMASYSRLGKELSATTTEVANAANDWFNLKSRSVENKSL